MRYVCRSANRAASVGVIPGRRAAAPRSPKPQRKSVDFLPLRFRAFLARQQSRRACVLRCAPAEPVRRRSPPALVIAIEPAAVADRNTQGESIMATIGTFKKSGAEYQGEIVTLSVQAKNVRLTPEDHRSNDNAPTHRVFVGRAEIGAAWAKRSGEGRDYLSVKRTIRRSTRRSTPTSSPTRTVRATPSSGPAGARPATDLESPVRFAGRGSLLGAVHSSGAASLEQVWDGHAERLGEALQLVDRGRIAFPLQGTASSAPARSCLRFNATPRGSASAQGRRVVAVRP